MRGDMVDRIADPWGERTPYSASEPWPVRVDGHPADPGPVDGWYRSASLLHSNGDAIDIAVRDGHIVGVRGRAGDRVNHSRLGPKDLLAVVTACESETATQLKWLKTRLKEAAPQTLVVSDG